MNTLLTEIVKEVLTHYDDANLISEEAKNRIAKDINEIFSDEPENLLNRNAKQEVIKFYEERKNEN